MVTVRPAGSRVSYRFGRHATRRQVMAAQRRFREKYGRRAGTQYTGTVDVEAEIREQERLAEEKRIREEKAIVQKQEDITEMKLKPVGVISKPPTGWERYVTSTAGGQLPVRGTLRFVGGWIQGKFGKLERKYTPQSQSLARTGAVSTVAQVAPFATPAGPVLAFGYGAEQFTPAGRREAKQFGKITEEKYGVPSRVGEYGTLGFGGLIGIGGARGVVSQVGKLRGYPKFQTRFVSEQVTAGDKKVFVRTVAQTERKELLTSKQYLSGLETDIRLFETVGKKTPFVSATRGASREYVRQLPTGKVKFMKPQKFGVAEVGEIQSKDIKLLVSRGKGFEVRKDLERGFAFRGVGAVKTYGREHELFFAKGGGGMIGKKGVVISRSGIVKRKFFPSERVKILKAGRGTQMGRFYEKPSFERPIGISGIKPTLVKSFKTPPIAGLAKTQQIRAVEISLRGKPTPPTRMAYPPQQITTPTQITAYPKQRFQQRVKTTQLVAPAQAMAGRTSIRAITKLIPRARHRQAVSQRMVSLPAQKTAMKFAISPRQYAGTGQLQRHRLIPKRPSPVTVTTRLASSFPPVPPIFKLPSAKFGRMGLKDFKAVQRTKPVPSFKAFAFGITGKKAARGISGLRFVPIYKGFKFRFGRRKLI